MMPLSSARRLLAATTAAALCLSVAGAIHAATPSVCLAVSGGVVSVTSVAAAREYSRPWLRTTYAALRMRPVNTGSRLTVRPAMPAEELLLGSPTLSRIADFVLDPVNEVVDCLRSPDNTPREFGTAPRRHSQTFASSIFLNLSSLNRGAGLSLRYRF